METITRAAEPTPTTSAEATAATPVRPTVTLDDKYTLDKGRVYMTGTQALVRLLMAQKKRDEAAGLNTAGFVSGYRGSPLGAVDQELWRARKHLDAHQIQFVPGLNEELAATSVWGTQMVNLDPNATVDGVFAMWYGKGPGVDRSGDVFKHANVAGTSKHGGVLVIAGDDHTCKSSTLPHQSEHAFIAAMIPVLNPSGVREFIEFGLHGYAMSRYSGCWVGFKSISDTIESSSSFEIDPMGLEIKIPDSYPIPEGGFHMRWPDLPLEQESRLHRHRLYALLEYVRQNNINRQDWQAPDARLGIVTCGKSYLDVREALDMLGIDEDNAPALGLRLLKIGMTWPLEPEIIREFAQGLDEILVIEEKRQIIEYQIKEQLYHAPVDSRPRVVGKFDEAGEWVHEPQAGILLSPNGEITPTQIAHVLAMRMAKVQGADSLPASVLNYLVLCRAGDGFLKADASQPQRVPFFCSGCPHNTSTKVPEGSRATAGIGCHFMAQWMDRRTQTFTQMGGEGVSWIGQAKFTSTPHVFANLGDGTYMHSGSLAIRASKAAGVNITYKILVNDAVAMTGGQPVEGAPTVPQILQQVSAEGIEHVHLVSDEPELYKGMAGIPAHVQVHERAHMDALQRQLREVPGVSVLVYAQTCAAEKRRRRKRKEMLDPPKRVVINEEVCEGCGDCGVQSNCVSIQPLETPLGRKRTIDQSSCNKDLSCVQGFCPSFVTIEGGQLRKPAKASATPPENLPEPTLLDAQMWNIVVTGVGGTGVVTIGALLGMAAHLENKGVLVLDMAGLAQKGGAVMSHIRLANNPQLLHAARVVPQQVDLLLGCDLMVAAGNEAIASLDKQRSHAILNTVVAPTGAFTREPDWQVSPEAMAERVQQAAHEVQAIDASTLATALMGDAVATNVFMLGYAWQKGWIPLRADSLVQAIELNGAAVAMNKAAFAWGRQAALDIELVRSAAGVVDKHTQRVQMPQRLPTLKSIMEDRMQRLTAYQNAAYAHSYADFVNEIAAFEKAQVNSERFSREVATSLYKLMAYKDEYEVARLFVETGFLNRIDKQFEGEYQLRFHLAPPLLAQKDGQGRLLKSSYGPWVLKAYKALAKLKFLRGTALDVFGKTDERRGERAAIGEFKTLMQQVAKELQPHTLNTALELARLPQSIRGYGHVKERNAQAAHQKQERLLQELRYEAPNEQRKAG